MEYDTIIQVMDTLRVYVEVDEDGQLERFELFPDISMGDATQGGGA